VRLCAFEIVQVLNLRSTQGIATHVYGYSPRVCDTRTEKASSAGWLGLTESNPVKEPANRLAVLCKAANTCRAGASFPVVAETLQRRIKIGRHPEPFGQALPEACLGSTGVRLHRLQLGLDF
jgi:hypothetical protein